MTTASRAEPVQLANLIRSLKYLPVPWRIALKLALLAAALPLLYHGMKHSNAMTGALGMIAFGALWLYHGHTGSFAPDSDATTYSTSPTSGEAIIPGTHGLRSSGQYTAAGE